MEFTKKRGRPSRTQLEQAYEAGLKAAKGGGGDYAKGEAAGYQRAVGMFTQAIRFLKFEGTMQGLEHQKIHESIRGHEAGRAEAVGGSVGLPIREGDFQVPV